MRYAIIAYKVGGKDTSDHTDNGDEVNRLVLSALATPDVVRVRVIDYVGQESKDYQRAPR